MSATPETLLNTPILETPSSSSTFFNAVRARVDQVFDKHIKPAEKSSDNQATRDTRADTRLELKRLITDLKYRTERTAIILGTKGEQEVFMADIDALFASPESFAPPGLTKKLEILIEREVTKGVTRARRMGLSGAVNILTPDSADVRFNNPLLEGRTAIVPIDLHLSFWPEDTVGYALERARSQYKSRFNAIIILENFKQADKTPRGMLKLTTLKELDPNTRFADIEMDIIPPFATHRTPRKEVEKSMDSHGINIWPVVDETNWEMIGTITQESVVIQELRYNSALSTLSLSTDIQKEFLRNTIVG